MTASIRENKKCEDLLKGNRRKPFLAKFDGTVASTGLLQLLTAAPGPSRQFVVMHQLGSNRAIADVVRTARSASIGVPNDVRIAGWVSTSCGPPNGCPHPPRIATLC